MPSKKERVKVACVMKVTQYRYTVQLKTVTVWPCLSTNRQSAPHPLVQFRPQKQLSFTRFRRKIKAYA